MRLNQIWKIKTPTVSFEFFPAANPEGAAHLERVIDQLLFLEPDFVAVTFGAGGTTREESRQLVDKLLNDRQMELIAYFSGYGLPPDYVESILEDYQGLGVENLLVVRGDSPRSQPDFVPHPHSFTHASDLLTFIRPEFPFFLGVAGYPEGHTEAESKDKDLDYLKLKIDLGAEFIITSYFYDNRFFFDFVDRCLAKGIQVPILPTIMPIFNRKVMQNMAKRCGVSIPAKLAQELAVVPEEDQRALINFGIDFAASQCRELIQAGVVGLHFYTSDRSQATAAIVSHLRREGLV